MQPIVILGPTAGGKSELAVRLAELVRQIDGRPGEVIGADSMQVYRRMDAGTAKPTPQQRARVPHHLIDIVEPTERFTVADWLSRADALVASLQREGVRPIIVGGTNLYIRAFLEGLFEGPPADPAYRQSLESVPVTELHERLRQADPAAADRIAATDRRRITRALEVLHLTGRPISDWQQQWQEPETERGAEGEGRGAMRGAGLPTYRHDPILVGLTWPAEAINPRINLRVKAMFHPDKVDPALAAEVCIGGQSLPEETRQLEAANLLGPQAREALGYKQVLAHLASRCTLEEACEQTKIQTRRFARQQRTWLKRFRGVHWLAAAELDAQAIATKAFSIVEAASRQPFDSPR